VPLAEFAWASAHRLLSGGTVIHLAIDGAGDLAAATSTSGWARKYPGRVGDTPIIGAGLYADNRYGACGCTHTGEMMVRAGTARSVILYMKRGATVEEACHEALADLRGLKGGYTSAAIIHALNPEGRFCAVSSHDLGGDVACCYWSGASEAIARVAPAVVPL
jgi:L-asparaginase